MNQKKIIIFVTTLFILCSGYLFFVSDRGLKSDAEKSWWVAYFESAQSNSLNFTIENHGTENNFHWEIKTDNQRVEEGDIEIKTGEFKSIQPETIATSGKTSIVVSNDGEKKEIYKQR